MKWFWHRKKPVSASSDFDLKVDARVRETTDDMLTRFESEQVGMATVAYGLDSAEVAVLRKALRLNRYALTEPRQTLSDIVMDISPSKHAQFVRQKKLKADAWKASYDAGRKVIMDAADEDLCAAAMEPDQGLPERFPSVCGRIFKKGSDMADYEYEIGDDEVLTKHPAYPRQGETCRIYARALDNSAYRRKKNGVVVRAVLAGVKQFVADRVYGEYVDVTVRFGDKNLSLRSNSRLLRRDVNGHLRLYIPLDAATSTMFAKHMGSRQMQEYCMLDVEFDRAMRKAMEEEKMPMSRDRVEFTLGGYSGGTVAMEACIKAAIETLGIDHSTAVKACRVGGSPVVVRARPSQFARFLILRNEYGGVNDFKGLKAKLVPAVEEPVVIDVAGNRNTIEV